VAWRISGGEARRVAKVALAIGLKRFRLGNGGKRFMGKRRVILFLFSVMFGLFPLLNSLRNPRLDGLHGFDIVQLIASGLCFGFSLGVLIGGRRFLGD
jgi:hypothetical protein